VRHYNGGWTVPIRFNATIPREEPLTMPRPYHNSDSRLIDFAKDAALVAAIVEVLKDNVTSVIMIITKENRHGIF